MMRGGQAEITGWYVTEDGEHLGNFDLVLPETTTRRNPSSAEWPHFGPPRQIRPRFPRLTRKDYQRLLKHAVEWIGAADMPGDTLRLSVGNVHSLPDLGGGTAVEFRSDPLRRGVYYDLSASVLRRRAAAR